MKKLSLIPFIVMSLVASPSWGETLDDLVERDGLYYKKFSDVPFTGEIKTKEANGWIKDGRKEGYWTEYFSNGQLWHKGDYKNGNREGPWVFYYKTGGLSATGKYENGKREGFWISHNELGGVLMQGEYKNDKKEGRWVYNSPDEGVRKAFSGVYKDGVKISD